MDEARTPASTEPAAPADSYLARFEEYFAREVAHTAAKSLSNGVGIEFLIRETSEVFHFTKEKGLIQLRPGAAPKPELVLSLGQASAEEILSAQHSEIAQAGIQICQLVLAQEPERRIEVSLRVGILKLLTQGYFGILTAGGSSFASFLASQGLGGIDAIKTALQRMRGSA
jgi:hypothetical protein